MARLLLHSRYYFRWLQRLLLRRQYSFSQANSRTYLCSDLRKVPSHTRMRRQQKFRLLRRSLPMGQLTADHDNNCNIRLKPIDCCIHGASSRTRPSLANSQIKCFYNHFKAIIIASSLLIFTLLSLNTSFNSSLDI